MERRPSLAEALDAYFDDLTLTASPHTTRTYRSLLKPLHALDTLDDFDTAYCRQLVAQTYRTRTAGTAITLRGALGGFGSWLLAQGHTATNPAKGVPFPRKQPKPRQILTKTQMRAIWNACQDDRTRLALLLLGQGLRRSEVVSVRAADVRPDGTVALVGKGGRRRRIVLHPAAMAMIAHLAPKDRLVAVEPDTLYRQIRALGLAAGCGHVTPHRFRHAWATTWMLETQDMETLRTLGGWAESSPMPRMYAEQALEEAAVIKARAVGLDLFGE